MFPPLPTPLPLPPPPPGPRTVGSSCLLLFALVPALILNRWQLQMGKGERERSWGLELLEIRRKGVLVGAVKSELRAWDWRANASLPLCVLHCLAVSRKHVRRCPAQQGLVLFIKETGGQHLSHCQLCLPQICAGEICLYSDPVEPEENTRGEHVPGVPAPAVQ